MHLAVNWEARKVLSKKISWDQMELLYMDRPATNLVKETKGNEV